MGKPTGFLEFSRELPGERWPLERIHDWEEISLSMPEIKLQQQAARCMDCGVPFCQTGQLINGMASGCPLNILIPECCDLVYRGMWRKALDYLLLTNNFPEFTGRVCEAPCEGSCVLGIIDPPVTIKSIENAIIDKGFEEGWVQPEPPRFRTGKKVTVVGSGPAGLACAAQLNKAGHWVVVYERADRIGGLLMYGIPNFRLDKEKVVQRRINLLKAEGIKFVTNCEVGKTIPAQQLMDEYDAVVLCGGATKPNDLPVEGRHLKGIHFVMDFLRSSTKTLLDDRLAFSPNEHFISAKDKDVVIISGHPGGWAGELLRQRPRRIVCFDLLPAPPLERTPDNPWPQWPRVFKRESFEIEASSIWGSDPRVFGTSAKHFVGDKHGHVKEVISTKVNIKIVAGRLRIEEIPGTEQVWPAQLVILSLGFRGPEDQLLDQLGIERDERSNVKAEYSKFATSVEGIFVAGDMRRGQSQVVWAINEGRGAAREVDRWLMGETCLS